MADWQTISSLATAGGTLVLAVATFSAVRSSNRSARVAEEALRVGLRPLLVPSLIGDPVHKAVWADGHVAKVEGGRAVIDQDGDVIYMAVGLRNAGSGIALIHGWYCMEHRAFDDRPHAAPEEFRRQGIDLYIPAGGTGYWEAAVRDLVDPMRPGVEKALADQEPFRLDLLYGDQEGVQRTISRFLVIPAQEFWYTQAARHWNLDRPDPR
ncbi:MAG TPA: hypothetical protein VMU14_09045 [Acidimicrobiales bacterium]|nr:hypothetical protein [Acidimicrobiales bacterium]